VEIKEILVEGKTKKLYTVKEQNQLVMEFLNTLKGDSKQKDTLKGKGAINTEISAFMFEYLASYNVPTHYIRKLDEKSLLVKKLDMIPIRLVIWNIATGNLAKRIGFKDGTILETPVLELYLKNTKLRNPFINDYHAYTLGLCDRNEMDVIIRIGSKVNAVLKSFFARKKLSLAYFSLEFGRYENQIMLGDEISPDTFSIWEVTEDGKLNKKTFEMTPATARTVLPKLKDIILM